MSYKGEKYQIPQVSQESTPDFQSDSYRKRKVSQSVPKDVIEEKVRNGEKLEELITNDGYNISKKLDIDNNEDKSRLNSMDSLEVDDNHHANIVNRIVIQSRRYVFRSLKTHKTTATRVFLLALFVLYFVYFGFAISYGWNSTYSYCDGVKFLFILTVLVASGLIYFQIIKRFFGEVLTKEFINPLTEVISELWERWFVRWLTYLVLIASVVVFLVIDTKKERRRLISVAGLFVFNLIGYLISRYPHRVNCPFILVHMVKFHLIVIRKIILCFQIRWRHVFWGLGLQLIFALLVLRWNVGREVFQCLGDKVQAFLDYTDQGSEFVFGYLVSGVLNPWVNVTIEYNNVTFLNESTVNLPLQEQLFGFKVLPVMFYFSFFISILYYYGIMQWVVQKLGWCLQVTIGTTACESINAAACIFVGQSEAPLVIKPYIDDMTESEIHAVMTGGFANVAGSTLAAYISFGISASHLLTASIMSAPAALGISKLVYPEVQLSKTTSESIKLEKGEEKTALEAAANGASIAIGLVANVAANLISFIAFIYFLDGVLSWMGGLVGWDFITFEWILAQVFTPLAYLMGVEWDDCEEVGKLIGIKTIINEFVAYSELADMQKNNEISDRSATIATYALCGFSNLSSMGIQLGVLGSLAPNRKPALAKVVVTALVAGSMACFTTACVAGALVNS